ncbi:MAG: hypothetical protein GX749_05460, partial [Ruminococcaceae bacterium]|nr:hypothetical protein [Oscillospiraceae bacterium]
MNNYDRAFDLIGISRGGGGFGLSGGASGEAPYDPYRMWYDKGNIHENSSLGVSQQLTKQGQIEAKAREEYEREQRKQWDEAHKNEKSGSFSDAEKQQRDADVKEKMKEYDSDLTLQEETIKRIRPDLSSAEAANERRAAERTKAAKQQNEDAALAAAHSYLEGIDDGHGEPDLSSGGTPPPKKKQSGSGDTNKVAKEALEKAGTPKEVPAAEIKRPAIVEPDNLELKVGEELLTYETEGVYYALYAYNEDEFGQTRLPQWLEDLRSVGSTAGDYLITRFSGGEISLKPYTDGDWLEEVTPSDLVINGGLSHGYALYAYSDDKFGQFPIPPNWINAVPAATEAGILMFEGIDEYGTEQFSWLEKIPAALIGATNSPTLNQYPKYAGDNKVTWVDFPTIPDEEVTPSDLVINGGLQVGYALYAYSEDEFG